MGKAKRQAHPHRKKDDEAQHELEPSDHDLNAIMSEMAATLQDCGHEALHVLHDWQQLKKHIATCNTKDSPRWLQRIRYRLSGFADEVKQEIEKDRTGDKQAAANVERIRELEIENTRLLDENMANEGRVAAERQEMVESSRQLQIDIEALRARQTTQQRSDAAMIAAKDARLAQLNSQVAKMAELDSERVDRLVAGIATQEKKIGHQEEEFEEALSRWPARNPDLAAKLARRPTNEERGELLEAKLAAARSTSMLRKQESSAYWTKLRETAPLCEQYHSAIVAMNHRSTRLFSDLQRLEQMCLEALKMPRERNSIHELEDALGQLWKFYAMHNEMTEGMASPLELENEWRPHVELVKACLDQVEELDAREKPYHKLMDQSWCPQFITHLSGRLAELSKGLSVRGTKVRVDHMHRDLTRGVVRGLFERQGPIRSFRLLFDHSGISADSAFITYEDENSADRAAAAYDGCSYRGRYMEVRRVPGV